MNRHRNSTANRTSGPPAQFGRANLQRLQVLNCLLAGGVLFSLTTDILAQNSYQTTASSKHSGPITLRPQSNLCVVLRIDQRIWPKPLLPTADHDFSLAFAAEIAREHERAGGSLFLPGGGSQLRVVANDGGRNPLCAHDQNDIHINAAYYPLKNGKPFTISYQIRQGNRYVSGKSERDILVAWENNEMPKIGHTPLEDAIIEDIRARSKEIYDLLAKH